MHQRCINTKFWSDNFIVELDPIERYLFLYFLTNEHTNIAGVYELPLKIMAFETGLDKEMLLKIIDRFTDKIRFYNGWIFIKNFPRHQKLSGENVDKGIKYIWDNVPQEIKEGLIRGMQGVSIPFGIEKEKRKRKRIEREEEEESNTPLSYLSDIPLEDIDEFLKRFVITEK